jgi:hypothetical protein
MAESLGPDAVNAATLKPQENLVRLRADLKDSPDLRRELHENPNAVLNRYNLSVDLPTGTLSRLTAGRGITIPPGLGAHADQHFDTHIDFNPHVDSNPHIDLG